MTRRRLRAALAPWFEVLWEEGLDAGLGLAGGAAWFAKLVSGGAGERVFRRLGDGPARPRPPRSAASSA